MTPRNEAEAQEQNVWESLLETSRTELESLRRELKELNMMIDQSQLEVNKWTQRNTTINTQLQLVQNQFDSIPRGDIRSSYDAALEAQQRLFLMRGQLDKMQSDKSHMERYFNNLEQVVKVLETNTAPSSGKKGYTATTETVEMMIRAQEAERQRLARQMHDGPAQALSNFILQTEIAMRLFDLDQAKAREELTSLKTAASSTFQKVRSFIFDLRPMMLDDLGLVPTLNRYIEAFKGQNPGVEIRFNSSGMDQRLESYMEVMIFRAVQELLSNSLRHSQATQVRLQIDASSSGVKISVDDNGRGFDTKTLEASTGMGLKVIRDRVEMLGGDFDVESSLGRGTRVVFTIPNKK